MKEKFLEYCKYFSKELEETQRNIDNDYHLGNVGTLADLGFNYSFELANIGFELGYASWFFETKNNVLESFKNTIIENEKIIGCYNEQEIEDIRNKIMRCKKMAKIKVNDRINELLETEKDIYNIIEILVNEFKNCDIITNELGQNDFVPTEKEMNKELENEGTNYIYDTWVEKIYDYILYNNLCDKIKNMFKETKNKSYENLDIICKKYNIIMEDYLYLEGYTDFEEYLEDLEVEMK